MQVERIEENLADQQEYMDKLIQLKRDLIIKAPANGLVVYARDGRNEKIKSWLTGKPLGAHCHVT